MTTDRERLRVLARLVTPGEWRVDGDAATEPNVGIVSDDCETHPIAEFYANHTCRDIGEWQANAEFIALARNALPAILQALDEAEEMRKALDRVPLPTPARSYTPFEARVLEWAKTEYASLGEQQ